MEKLKQHEGGPNTATNSTRDSLGSDESASRIDSIIPELIQLTNMMIEKNSETEIKLAEQAQQIRDLSAEVVP